MKNYGLGILLFLLSSAIYAENVEDPCSGSLLSIVNRPSASDTACVVPNKEVLVEGGLQIQSLIGSGYQQNLPEAQIRLGLPKNNEFNVTLPNFVHQSSPSQFGYNASIVGFKHEFPFSAKWVTAIETLVTIASGSDNFGSKGYGAAINGLFSYNINEKFNLSGLIGINTQSDPRSEGGGRFNSFNPDIVFTWSPSETVNFFIEAYGQTKTAAHSGSGYNADAGILYLIQKHLSLDVEIGQRLSGSLGNFEHYFGTGFVLEFN
jgi:hypothetical protein